MIHFKGNQLTQNGFSLQEEVDYSVLSTGIYKPGVIVEITKHVDHESYDMSQMNTAFTKSLGNNDETKHSNLVAENRPTLWKI